MCKLNLEFDYFELRVTKVMQVVALGSNARKSCNVYSTEDIEDNAFQ